MSLVGGFVGPFNPRDDWEREGVPAKRIKRERGRGDAPETTKSKLPSAYGKRGFLFRSWTVNLRRRLSDRRRKGSSLSSLLDHVKSSSRIAWRSGVTEGGKHEPETGRTTGRR